MKTILITTFAFALVFLGNYGGYADKDCVNGSVYKTTTGTSHCIVSSA